MTEVVVLNEAQEKEVSKIISRIGESQDNKSHLDKIVIYELFKKAEREGIPTSDFISFIRQAQLTGASPIRNHIYLYPSWSKDGTSGTVVFNYNFIMRLAQETGERESVKCSMVQIGTKFNPDSLEEEKDLYCEATIVRKGHEYKAVAWAKDYCKRNKSGTRTGRWLTAFDDMLMKCAISKVHRLAFPEVLDSVYSQEEMENHVGEIIEYKELEAQAIERKESEEIKEIKKEKLIEKLEKSDEIDSKIELIKNTMSVICSGYDLKNKAEAMKTYLKVSKFDELKDKSLDELEDLCKIVTEVKTSLKKQKKEVSDASFTLTGG